MGDRDRRSEGERLDAVVAAARRASEQRQQGYRERALALFPWVCARCAREFDRAHLAELTVHHKDHDHDNNPPDGSNWELLCVYCHEQEHIKYLEAERAPSAIRDGAGEVATHRPLAELERLLKK